MVRVKIVLKTMDGYKAVNGRRGTSLRIRRLFAIIIPLLFLSNAGNSLMIKLPLERLSLDADFIVFGEVKDIEYQWSMDRSTIVTIVTLEVHRVIKGSFSRGPVLIQYPGGEIGEIGLKVSDQPSFELREKTLVFLEPIKDKNDPQNSFIIAMDFWPGYTVFGAAQGKYSVDDNGVARKEGYSLISDEPDPDRSLLLGNLITRIRKSLRRLDPGKKKIREKR